MSKIFLSYRRDDTQHITSRIKDHLVGYFDKLIFMDISNIQVGQNFADVLNFEILNADVVIVVIGQHWLTIRDAYGRAKLFNDDDWVRFEIATALQNEKAILPILVDNANMPSVKELPSNIQGLSYVHALRVHNDNDSNFAHCINQLIRRIEEYLNIALINELAKKIASRIVGIDNTSLQIGEIQFIKNDQNYISARAILSTRMEDTIYAFEKMGWHLSQFSLLGENKTIVKANWKFVTVSELELIIRQFIIINMQIFQIKVSELKTHYISWDLK